MSTSDHDHLVGEQIWLVYFDQNYIFELAFTPQFCEIVRRIPSVDGANDWYLVRLEKPIVYEGTEYGNFLIRSRWAGCEIGGGRATAVFIVLVPDPDRLKDPFEMDRSLYIAWGRAGLTPAQVNFK